MYGNLEGSTAHFAQSFTVCVDRFTGCRYLVESRYNMEHESWNVFEAYRSVQLNHFCPNCAKCAFDRCSRFLFVYLFRLISQWHSLVKPAERITSVASGTILGEIVAAI